MNQQAYDTVSSCPERLTNSNGLLHTARYQQDKACLEINLFDGTVYQYFEVPKEIFANLCESDDPDEYYRSNVRYNYRRLFKRFSFWE
ncbi:MAG: KTSC domain-containing protein [Bacteroidales bacterium]|nr:KTSC domain-containing protein [Bacteroidales bacterium]